MIKRILVLLFIATIGYCDTYNSNYDANVTLSVTAGDLIIVGWSGTDVGVGGITDTVNTYTTFASSLVAPSSNVGIKVAWAKALTTASLTITVNTPPSDCGVSAHAYSGMDTVTPIEQWVLKKSSYTGTSYATDTLTARATAGKLFCYWAQEDTGRTLTATSGYTKRTEQATHVHATTDKAFTSAGAYNATMTYDGSTAVGWCFVVLKAASTTNAHVLVVGGGGGSGSSISGGGGGGGYQYNDSYAVTAQAYLVTVGTGGAAGAWVGSSQGDLNSGGKGGDSVFGTIRAYGGGAGGAYDDNKCSSGTTGGCGGGKPAQDGNYTTFGLGLQGYNGGNVVTNYYGGGGGGGAGAVGGNATTTVAGAGGAGAIWAVNGSTYAGGGGGGGYSSGSAGGAGSVGGGGAGSKTGTGTAGTDNLGGGGGGSNYHTEGAKGGNGVVIIAYKTDGSDGISTDSTGGTITTVGDYTLHTFTYAQSGTSWTMVATGGGTPAPSGRRRYFIWDIP